MPLFSTSYFCRASWWWPVRSSLIACWKVAIGVFSTEEREWDEFSEIFSAAAKTALLKKNKNRRLSIFFAEWIQDNLGIIYSTMECAVTYTSATFLLIIKRMKDHLPLITDVIIRSGLSFSAYPGTLECPGSYSWVVRIFDIFSFRLMKTEEVVFPTVTTGIP